MLVLWISLFKKFSRIVVYCLIIKVRCLFSALQQLCYYITLAIRLSRTFFIFSKFFWTSFLFAFSHKSAYIYYHIPFCLSRVFFHFFTFFQTLLSCMSYALFTTRITFFWHSLWPPAACRLPLCRTCSNVCRIIKAAKRRASENLSFSFWIKSKCHKLKQVNLYIADWPVYKIHICYQISGCLLQSHKRIAEAFFLMMS